MKNNAVNEKSFELAKETVYLYQFLTREEREYVLSRQLLKSGTSVGANISEGVAGQSRKDFIHRLSIAYKESRETEFWLKLLCSTGYLTQDKAGRCIAACEEVIRLLFTILRTAAGKNIHPT
jgi:four helix bundle protein